MIEILKRIYGRNILLVNMGEGTVKYKFDYDTKLRNILIYYMVEILKRIYNYHEY